MEKYKIEFFGDKQLENMHHIGLAFRGNYYSVIFGECVNGGFFYIYNWKIGGELSSFDDVVWNADSIASVLDDDEAANAIARMISTYRKNPDRDLQQ